MTRSEDKVARRATRNRAVSDGARRSAAGRADTEAKRREERRRTRRRRRHTAQALFTAAGLVAVGHILEHAGLVQLFNPALEDIAVGFPTAGGLAIAGGIALGR